MARPLKDKEIVKDHTIKVRLSGKEKRLITKKASSAGLKLGTYLREAGLSCDDSRLPRLRKEYSREINKIGHNINQIAHHMNEVVKIGGSINYQEISQKLTQYYELLHQHLDNMYLK